MAEPQIKDYTEFADSSLASKGSLLGRIDSYESFVGEDIITEPDKLSEAEVSAILQKMPPEMFKSGVIASQVIATARSGKRVEIDGVNNRINFYNQDGDNGIRFLTDDGTFVSDIVTFYNSANGMSSIDLTSGGGSKILMSGKSNLGSAFFGFENTISSSLNGSISTGATSVVLADASTFATAGDGVIEDNLDYFSWTGKSSNTLTGVTGIDFAHSSGTSVSDLAATTGGLTVDWSGGDFTGTITSSFNTRVAFTKTAVTLGAGFTIDAQTDAQTSYLVLTGSAARTSSVTTAIEDSGTTGNILILEGTSDTNTITILDGANTILIGDAILKSGDTLTLIFNGTVWVEVARAISNYVIAISGTYTPTVSDATNLASDPTVTLAFYTRIGDVVTVSGQFTADVTTTLTVTNFELSLPIASNITALEDVVGMGTSAAAPGEVVQIWGETTNNTAEINWIATDVTSNLWSYTFTYRII